jgi:hypothetical protein
MIGLMLQVGEGDTGGEVNKQSLNNPEILKILPIIDNVHLAG